MGLLRAAVGFRVGLKRFSQREKNEGFLIVVGERCRLCWVWSKEADGE